MASYRFCRPDDVPLLIQALNDCSQQGRIWTPERFKALLHELDLWPGTCMVALHDGKPIAVLVTAKRDKTVHILELVTHPDHLRQGHAGHLLSSLRQKLDILSPQTTLEVLVPAGRVDLISFFEGQGYQADTGFVDLVLKNDLNGISPPKMICQPVTVDDVEGLPTFAGEGPMAWQNCPRSLRQRSQHLKGVAIPSVDGWLAYLLYSVQHEGIVIEKIGIETAEKNQVLLSCLFMEVHKRGRPLRVSPLWQDDGIIPTLLALGFERDQGYMLFKNRD